MYVSFARYNMDMFPPFNTYLQDLFTFLFKVGLPAFEPHLKLHQVPLFKKFRCFACLEFNVPWVSLWSKAKDLKLLPAD